MAAHFSCQIEESLSGAVIKLSAAGPLWRPRQTLPGHLEVLFAPDHCWSRFATPKREDGPRRPPDFKLIAVWRGQSERVAFGRFSIRDFNKEEHAPGGRRRG